MTAVTSRDLFLALAEVLDLPRECVSMEIKLSIDQPVRIRIECHIPKEKIGSGDIVDCVSGFATAFSGYELVKVSEPVPTLHDAVIRAMGH